MPIITAKADTAIRLHTFSAIVKLNVKGLNGLDKTSTINTINATMPSNLNDAIIFFIIIVYNKVKVFFVNHYFNNGFFSSWINRSKRVLILFSTGVLAISKLLI
jgi:hypothetical protein